MNGQFDKMLDALTWIPREDKTKTIDENITYATHSAVLEVGGKKLRCYQLSNGMLVFDADDIADFFGAME